MVSEIPDTRISEAIDDNWNEEAATHTEDSAEATECMTGFAKNLYDIGASFSTVQLRVAVNKSIGIGSRGWRVDMGRLRTSGWCSGREAWQDVCASRCLQKLANATPMPQCGCFIMCRRIICIGEWA